MKFIFIKLVLVTSFCGVISVKADDELYTNIPAHIIQEANQDNAEAQFTLAKYLQNKETEAAYQEARKWYKRSSDKGNFKSGFNLGRMYYHGIGGTPDIEEAIKLFKSSAISGSMLAAEFLGRLYYTGEASPYLEKNAYKAVRAYKIAAQRGHPSAQTAAWHIADEFPDLRSYASPEVEATLGYGGI